MVLGDVGMRGRPAVLLGLAVAAVLMAVPYPAAADGCRGKRWLGVWAASPTDSTAGAFVEQTLRLVVHPTYGGSRVRVKLSNRFGSQPVTFGAATVARRGAGAAVAPGSTRPLRFAGLPSVTIPPGGEVLSDPLRFRVAAFRDLVVSLHVVASGAATQHAIAMQTSYVSPPGSGDRTADTAGAAFTRTIGEWPFLADLEVRAAHRVGGLVVIGDSITVGFPEPVDGNGRYSDLLARRLARVRSPRIAIQNAGISGNRLLSDGFLPAFGPSLLARLDADAIDQAGVGIVLLMIGTNDLGLVPRATAADVVAGLEVAVARLRAAGLRVLLGTQPPSKGMAGLFHGTAEAIAARNAINAWIRTSGVADGVVDFHAALRDPADPDRLHPAFDSGDHLHPSPAGYQAMADAVDLDHLRDLLADAPCR